QDLQGKDTHKERHATWSQVECSDVGKIIPTSATPPHLAINARRLSIRSINDLRQRHGSVRDFWTCMFCACSSHGCFSAVVHTSKSAAGVSLPNKQQGIDRDRCIAPAPRATDTSDAERVFQLHLGEVVFLKSAHEGWWVLRCYHPPVSAQAGASTGAANSPPRICVCLAHALSCGFALDSRAPHRNT